MLDLDFHVAARPLRHPLDVGDDNCVGIRRDVEVELLDATVIVAGATETRCTPAKKSKSNGSEL